MTDLAKLVVRLEAEIGKYSEKLDTAERQLKKFSKSADNILGNLAGSVAAYFTVDKLIDWGQHILQNADHLAKFSQSTGIAVEDLSRLDYALKASGVEGENTGKLLKELNSNLSDAAGNARGDAAAAFKALGISVRDGAGDLKDGQQVLLEMADRFKGYEDGANKSTLATALLGKAGASAVPFLNQGADGIRRLTEEADRLGATVSGETARAAEEFNDRLGRMKTLVVDGIGGKIAEQLLPTLNNLGDSFESNADRLDALNHAAEVAATGLKILLSAGLVIANVFDELGTSLGALAAAAVAAVQFDFSRVASIVRDNEADIEQKDKAFQKRWAAIWREGGDDVLREVKVTAQYMKQEAPNLAATKEIEKAAEDSLKKLTEFHQQLAEQVKTFGLGEAEATRYRLTLGNLSDEVTKAGTAGLKMRDAILADAEALQKLKDTKEIEKALADVRSQIEALQGNKGDAAIAAFDAKNAELVTKLRREGNVQGQKQLDTLLTLIVAQADYNELNEKASRIEQDLAIQEERLNNSRAAGALTDLDLQQKLGAAREKAAGDLQGIYEAQEKIAAQTKNPEMEDNLKRFGQNIENLKAQTDVLGNALRKTFEDTLSDGLFRAAKNFRDLGDIALDVLNSIADRLLKMATDQLVQKAIGGLSGAGGGGGGGGTDYFALAASLFGGGRAAGGPVIAGHSYNVNEGTPDRERFIAPSNGRIERAGGSRAMSVQQTFILQTDRGGMVPRQTQLQVGAQAAKGLADAQRRNG